MKNHSLQNQMDELVDIIDSQPYLRKLYDVADRYLTNYYIGAGCITQTVWNILHGYEPMHGIGDADIVYFDIDDRTGEKERLIEESIRNELPDFPIQIDVTNEAMVHVWYERKFGRPIDPYHSLEEAIDTWPTTASSIGVRRRRGKYGVYAPYGLHDLFAMIVKPNKVLVSEEIYEQKARKWKQRWPELTIMPW